MNATLTLVTTQLQVLEARLSLAGKRKTQAR